ncbi:MAG: 4-hydroxy-tetrahydrodipicolinate synthase [Holosporales bacterium]
MFNGSFVALVTPFCETGIDQDALKKLIDLHINAGTKGIIIAGTTGESTLLSPQEREDLIVSSIAYANKRIPIIVGCSSSSTDEAVGYATHAKTLGADAILVMTPYYVKPTQEGIYQHFKALDATTDLPIIVYNHPGRAGLDISIETMVRIFDLPHIQSLKDSNVDMQRAKTLRERLPANKTLLSGDDPTIIDYLKAGGSGWISVTANIEPLLMKSVFDLWQADEHTKATALNDSLIPLHNALGLEPNPQPVKYILSQKGMINPLIKAPLMMPTSAVAQQLNAFC